MRPQPAKTHVCPDSLSIGTASRVRAQTGGFNWTGLYERVAPSVVRVEAGLGHGSGFLMKAGEVFVVTNDHVVAGDLNSADST